MRQPKFSHEETMQIWTALQQFCDNHEPIDDNSPKPSPHAVSALEKCNAYAVSLEAREYNAETTVPCTLGEFRGHLASLAEQCGISTIVIEMWSEELSVQDISKEVSSLMFEHGKTDELLFRYRSILRKYRQVEFLRK